MQNKMKTTQDKPQQPYNNSDNANQNVQHRLPLHVEPPFYIPGQSAANKTETNDLFHIFVDCLSDAERSTNTQSKQTRASH